MKKIINMMCLVMIQLLFLLNTLSIATPVQNSTENNYLAAPVYVSEKSFLNSFELEIFKQGMSGDIGKKSPNALELIRQKERYGVLSPKKWLFHDHQVETFLDAAFYAVTPVTVQLVPSWVCNYLCLGCSYGLIKEDKRDSRPEDKKIKPVMSNKDKKMDFDLMIKIIDELKNSGVKAVTFTGGGEPFSHPRTVDMIQYAKKQGLEVGIFSNGSLLNKEKIKGILDAEPTFIRLSINAGSDDVHTLLHGLEKPVFEKVLKNLELLAKEKIKRQKAGLPGGKTEVHVGYIANPLNSDEISLLANRMAEIDKKSPRGGLSGLQIRPTVSYEGGRLFPPKIKDKFAKFKEKHPEKVKGLEAWEKFLFQGGQFSEDLWEKVEENISLFREERDGQSFIMGTNITVSVPLQKFADVSNPKPKAYEKCLAGPWVSFITPPNGEVSYCIEWGGNPEIVFGNLRDQSFEEIWQGEKRKQVVEHVNSCMVHKRCPPVCAVHEMNIIFHELKKLIEKGKHKEVENWIKEEKSKGLPNHWKFLYPSRVKPKAANEKISPVNVMVEILGKDISFNYVDKKNRLSSREEAILSRAFKNWINSVDEQSFKRIPLCIDYNLKDAGNTTPAGISINREVLNVDQKEKQQPLSDASLFVEGVVWHEGEHYRMYFFSRYEGRDSTFLEEIVQRNTLEFFEKNSNVKDATLRVLDKKNDNGIVGQVWIRQINDYHLKNRELLFKQSV